MIFQRNILPLQITMKRTSLYRLLFFVCTCILLLTGCGKLKQIRPTTFEIVSFQPQGLARVEVDFRLGIDNPAMQIGLSEISAEVMMSGKIIGKVSLSPFIMEAKSNKVYDMTALVELGTTIFNFLPILKDAEVQKKVTVNLAARATLKSGLSKKIELKDVPMEQIMKLTE